MMRHDLFKEIVNDKDKDKEQPYKLVTFEPFYKGYGETWHDQQKDKRKDKYTLNQKSDISGSFWDFSQNWYHRLV